MNRRSAHPPTPSIRALVVAAAILAPLPALSAPPAHPDYQPGGQYTARLDQARQQWQLLPADGNDLQVSASGDCAGDAATVPPGLWLLARDAAGLPQLRAPSTTPLPAGHPGEVALVACGQATSAGAELAAPPLLIDWLASHSGAVWVDD